MYAIVSIVFLLPHKRDKVSKAEITADLPVPASPPMYPINWGLILGGHKLRKCSPSISHAHLYMRCLAYVSKTKCWR